MKLIQQWPESDITAKQATVCVNLAMVVNAAVFAVFLVTVVIHEALSPLLLILCVVLEGASFATYGTARHIQGLLDVPLSGKASE